MKNIVLLFVSIHDDFFRIDVTKYFQTLEFQYQCKSFIRLSSTFCLFIHLFLSLSLFYATTQFSLLSLSVQEHTVSVSDNTTLILSECDILTKVKVLNGE